MLIVLFKKQITELLSNMLGGRPLKQGIFSVRMMIYLLLGFYMFILIFRVFWNMSATLCRPLCEAGNNWMYFALMGVMATFIGVTGSLFTANSTIYHAKDNEILLAMPIPQWMIVFVRMAMIYVVSAVFEFMVMFPVLIVYFLVAVPPVWAVLFQIAAVLLLPVIAVAVSCLIGWLTAVVNSRIQRRAIASVAASLGFIAVFYYVYWNLYKYLQLIIANADAVGGVVKIFLFPFYLMGRASEGSVVSFVIYVALMTVVMAVVVKLVSGNFVELAEKSRVAARRKGNKRAGKAESPTMALYKRELQRFTSSSVSMLSCAMGSIMLVVIGVMSIFAGDWIIGTFMGMTNGATENFPLVAMLIVTMMAAMNTITAASISLEGKYFWMLKVLPVSPWQIFKAKLGVHIFITGIPVIFCTAAFAAAGKVEFTGMLLMILAGMVFVVFSGMVGLLCNLKFPNFTWTSEAQAVKQNMSVITATFAPWGMLLLLAFICLCMRLTGASVNKCMLSAAALTAGVSFLLAGKLMRSGSERFMEL